MDNSEMSLQFDILYNNINSNQSPGFNSYEKSIFLTKAQNEILKNHLNPNSPGNNLKEGFDDNEKRQIDFSMLMDSAEMESLEDCSCLGIKFDSRSLVYEIPDNVFVILNEQLLIKQTDNNQTKDIFRQINPISYVEYLRLMSKPLKEPLKNQVWRLLTGTTGIGKLAELILTTDDLLQDGDKIYVIRYVKKPTPIILENLEDYGEGVSIEGFTQEMPCKLDTILHDEIVQRAVELAKGAYVGNDNNQVTLTTAITTGQRSE